jgi:uncharacterized membrane protein YkvA (DUF1232 family)
VLFDVRQKNKRRHIAMANNDYGKSYDDESFWDKVTNYAKTIGREIAHKAISMYYALQDPDTPAWAKGVIVVALGYFNFPADAIPDFIPGVGLADDAGALATAFGTVLIYIKQAHKDMATAKCDEWFGEK